jgi:beta-phosphoglucomutase-like phosphatase (HAD superfamily)
MSLQALIFDVDGTLADTEDLHRQAFNGAFDRHGLDWHWGRRTYSDLLKVTGGHERLARFIDLAEMPIASKVLLRGQIPVIHATKTILYTQYLAAGRIRLRDGIGPLIAEAHRAQLKLAIASTTTRTNIECLVRHLFGCPDQDLFDCIRASDSAVPKKPAPAIYSLVLNDLGLDARDVIAFEDSANGLASAKGAGLCTLVTPTIWTAGEDFSTADAVLPTLSGCDLNRLADIHARWLLHRKEAA